MGTYPNGIGETLGDSLVTTRPLISTGSVYYVSSVTGSASFSGLSKAQPLNTLANAQTAASNGDIIVLLDGHTETLSGALAITKNLTIVGSGSNAGIPTVVFRVSADVSLFTIAVQGVQLRNIRFQSSTAAATATQRIDLSGNQCQIIGCYFDCSGNDTGSALLLASGITGLVCKSTTFVATNTAANAPPGPGMDFVGTSTDVRLDGVVFDGGAYNFSGGLAYRESGAATRRYAENMSFLRGADYALHASSAQSYWMPTTTTGDVRG